jgi:hypothetical protein
LLVFFVSSTLAQNSSALINEALDKVFPLELNTTPLPIAMRAIGEQTGVRIEAASSVWGLLPWGDQTTVTARIEGKTLREALGDIARTLGLVVVLRDEAVELQPMPALLRLGRRSTVSELVALDVLASNPLGLNTERPTLRQLAEAVDARLEAIDESLKQAGKKPPGLAIELRVGEAVRSDQTIFVRRNATLAEALEAIPKETRATWHPWGKSILIRPKEDQIRDQLSKTITVRYNGVEIGQVLSELSQRSGVEFTIEPGAIQRIPTEFRTVRLVLDNATIKQALESIAGFTGLGYVVNDEGVYIWNQQNTHAGQMRDPIVGTIRLDNGMEVFVRQSQVAPDMLEYLRDRTQRELGRIRQMMNEEGFRPTTRSSSVAPSSPDL